MAKKIIILVSIIALAIFFRFFILDAVPAGFDPDEAEFAFNAYTLNKYLKNENNEFFPYQVDTYGNFRPLALPYLIAFSIKFFGNTVFAVRFPNACFGVLTVLAMFLFAKLIFRRVKTAFFASWLIAISPWSVFLSRGTAEPVMAMFFIIMMYIFLIKAWKSKNSLQLVLVYLFAFLAFFTYTGVLPLIFLLSGSLIFFLILRTKKIIWQTAIPFFTLIIFPILPIALTNPGYLNGRFKQTSVFDGMGKLGVKLVTEEQIRENGFNRVSYQNLITQFFHNVPINTVNTIFDNWTKHLSFEYLYFKGGEPNRLQVPQTGVFLLVESMFAVGGVLLLFQRRKYWLLLFAVSVVMISFLPAGLTVEEVPSTHRPIFAIVGFFLLESYFLTWFAGQVQTNRLATSLAGLMTVVLAYEIAFYLHNYLVLQPRHKNWYRHPEMYEAAKYVYLNKDKFDQIYWVKNSVEPVYFYYFFNRLDPKEVIDNPTKTHSASWSQGKITFVQEACANFETKDNEKYLVIEKAECETGGAFIKNMMSTDGTKILRVITK